MSIMNNVKLKKKPNNIPKYLCLYALEMQTLTYISTSFCKTQRQHPKGYTLVILCTTCLEHPASLSLSIPSGWIPNDWST